MVSASYVVVEADEFVDGADTFACPGCGGYNMQFTQTRNLMRIRPMHTATASVEDFRAVISSVTFMTTSLGSREEVKISWNFGDAVRGRESGRYFKWVPHDECVSTAAALGMPATYCSPAAARKVCGETSVLGLFGYLATPASEDESEDVGELPDRGFAWIGLSDWPSGNTAAGHKWVTGPASCSSCPNGCDMGTTQYWRSGCRYSDWGLDDGCNSTAAPDDSCGGGGALGSYQPWLPGSPSAATPGHDYVVLQLTDGWCDPREGHVSWRDAPRERGGTAALCQFDTLGMLDLAGTHTWGAATMMVDTCGWGTEAECLLDARCLWSSADFACRVAECTDQGASAAKCMALHPDCRWNPAAKVCQDEENECTDSRRTLCQAAGQMCLDRTPYSGATGDWLCVCIPPMGQGESVGAAGVCPYDECTLYTAFCNMYQQLCSDPNPTSSSTDDWQCVCPPSEPGPSATQAAAVCNSMCTAPDRAVCSAAAQACKYPSGASFECRCVNSEGSPAVGAPASCTLDECTAACPTCAGSTCGAAAQNCYDPGTDPSDPSHFGDWECRCPAPSAGEARTGGPTWCTLDECSPVPSVCSAAGQSCIDPDTSVDSLNDWLCVCDLRKGGTEALMAAAVCTADECVTPRGPPYSMPRDTCTAVSGQTCSDPGPTSFNDWLCRCPAPMNGSAQMSPAAVCTLDECAATCPTCAGVNNPPTTTICGQQEQVCEDKNVSEASLGDWVCKCAPPGPPLEAVGQPAECPDPDCSTGILVNVVCCELGCGSCGGADCDTRPGGSAGCCGLTILSNNVSCNTAGPPCVVQTPAPTFAPITPSTAPTTAPTAAPTAPTGSPTAAPAAPTGAPTATPVPPPTAGPSQATATPTAAPSAAPSAPPSSAAPSGGPTPQPAPAPSARPSAGPSAGPSTAPPSGSPSSSAPSASPSSAAPSTTPSSSPSPPPGDPSRSPLQPTGAPSAPPSAAPSRPPLTAPPSRGPSAAPVPPTAAPSLPPAPPTAPPTAPPEHPSAAPATPSAAPAAPSAAPSLGPSAAAPTASPSAPPSSSPAPDPSASPSAGPSPAGAAPSSAPSSAPSAQPIVLLQAPSAPPSQQLRFPTAAPSAAPAPRAAPSAAPSPPPAGPPSAAPSRRPAAAPSPAPCAGPRGPPTAAPSKGPSAAPVRAPSPIRPGVPPGEPAGLRCVYGSAGSGGDLIPELSSLFIQREQGESVRFQLTGGYAFTLGKGPVRALVRHGGSSCPNWPGGGGCAEGLSAVNASPPGWALCGAAPLGACVTVRTDVSADESHGGLLGTARRNPQVLSAVLASDTGGWPDALELTFTDADFRAYSPHAEHLQLSLSGDALPWDIREKLCANSSSSTDARVATCVCEGDACRLQCSVPLHTQLNTYPGRQEVADNQAVAIGVILTASTVFSVSSGTSLAAARMALIQSATSCPTDGPEKLDHSLNPLGLKFGGGDFAAYAGAVVGNMLIRSVLFGVCGLLYLYFCSRLKRERRATRGFGKLRREGGGGGPGGAVEGEEVHCTSAGDVGGEVELRPLAADYTEVDSAEHSPVALRSAGFMRSGQVNKDWARARARWGWLLVPLPFLYGGSMLGSIAAVVYCELPWKLLATADILTFGWIFPYYAYRVIARGRKEHAALQPVEGVSWRTRRVRWFFWGSVEWVPSSDNPESVVWMELHHLAFDGYLRRVKYFLMFEIIATVVLSAVTAWRPRNIDECWVRTGLMTAALAVLFLARLVYRPFIAPKDNVIETAVAALEVVTMICVIVMLYNDRPSDSGIGRTVRDLNVLLMWCVIGKFLIDAVIFLIDEYNIWRERGGRGGGCGFLRYYFCFRGALSLRPDADSEPPPAEQRPRVSPRAAAAAAAEAEAAAAAEAAAGDEEAQLTGGGQVELQQVAAIDDGDCASAQRSGSGYRPPAVAGSEELDRLQMSHTTASVSSGLSRFSSAHRQKQQQQQQQRGGAQQSLQGGPERAQSAAAGEAAWQRAEAEGAAEEAAQRGSSSAKRHPARRRASLPDAGSLATTQARRRASVPSAASADGPRALQAAGPLESPNSGEDGGEGGGAAGGGGEHAPPPALQRRRRRSAAPPPAPAGLPSAATPGQPPISPLTSGSEERSPTAAAPGGVGRGIGAARCDTSAGATAVPQPGGPAPGQGAPAPGSLAARRRASAAIPVSLSEVSSPRGRPQASTPTVPALPGGRRVSNPAGSPRAVTPTGGRGVRVQRIPSRGQTAAAAPAPPRQRMRRTSLESALAVASQALPRRFSTATSGSKGSKDEALCSPRSAASSERSDAPAE